MKPAEVSALRARWRSPEGRELARDAMRWLAGHRPRPSGLGEVDGRTDLRGLEFFAAAGIGEQFPLGGANFQNIAGMLEFRGVTWTHLDLSGAVIRYARFMNSVIADCRFERADLTDWRLWDVEVSDSSFEGADLRDSALGTGRFEGAVVRWTDVVFDRADLRHSHFTEARLHRVSFRGTKLRSSGFQECDLESVVFEGILTSVRFEATSDRTGQAEHWMRDVDFRRADLRSGFFAGYRMEDVRLADDVLLVTDVPGIIDAAVSLAQDEDDVVRFLVESKRGLVELLGRTTWDMVVVSKDLRGVPADWGDGVCRVYRRAMGAARR